MATVSVLRIKNAVLVSLGLHPLQETLIANVHIKILSEVI